LWPPRWSAAIQEHETILDALKAGDEEQAAQHMANHVRNGLSLVIARMKDAVSEPHMSARPSPLAGS
jgi:DNA-binding GntR family transcriptional regulator